MVNATSSSQMPMSSKQDLAAPACCVTLILVLLSIVPSGALHAADECERRAKNTIAELTTAAKNGDRSAQNTLGIHYATGQNVPRNYKTAVHWFQQAAHQQLPEAQNNLASIHIRGLAGVYDPIAARYWFSQAAERGFAEAQFALGVIYAKGYGVPPVPSLAADWFRKAAEQGHVRAQANLGALYQQGAGLPQNSERGAYWIRKAADQGFAPAQNALGMLYELGVGVVEDAETAARYYKYAAAQGHAEAQYNLGRLYHKGLGLPEDQRRAQNWFRKAAALGYKPASKEVPHADEEEVIRMPWLSKMGNLVNGIRKRASQITDTRPEPQPVASDSPKDLTTPIELKPAPFDGSAEPSLSPIQTPGDLLPDEQKLLVPRYHRREETAR